MRAALFSTVEGQHEASGVRRASGTRLDPLLGALIAGKFRVEHVLADGGMGRVYVARHEALDRRVALKVVRHDDEDLERSHGSEAQRRFRFEASVLARLRHPNIVTLLDFGELDGPSGPRSYLAMELLEGPTLAERIFDARRLPLEEVLELGEQIVQGLQFAHGLGVVHRDMKPSNVVLVPSETPGRRATVKIVDFGTSKLLQPERAASPSGRLTREGFAVGTPEYMPPEQLQGRPCAASDLFALGVILFEALTGVLPFDVNVEASVRWRSPAPRLRVAAPGLVVPERVEQLVARLLAFAPGKRPTAPELLDELRRCAWDAARDGGEPPEGERARGHGPASSLARRAGSLSSTRRVALAAAAVTLVAGITTALASGLAYEAPAPSREAHAARSAKATRGGAARERAEHGRRGGTAPHHAPVPSARAGELATNAASTSAPPVGRDAGTRTEFSVVDTETH